MTNQDSTAQLAEDTIAKNLRINDLEVLRAFAFIFVVAQHIFGGLAWHEGLNDYTSLLFSLIYVIAKPAVPMFLVLVGITLFISSKNKKPNFLKFYVSRGDGSLSQQKTQLKAACGEGFGNWRCMVMGIFVGN